MLKAVFSGSGEAPFERKTEGVLQSWGLRSWNKARRGVGREVVKRYLGGERKASRAPVREEERV